AVGLDTLVVVKALEILEKEMDLVILLPFYYGASSYAVEPPEGSGTVHVGAEKLFPFAQEMFRGLLRIGFRNIHVFIHHQTENFAAGMPTDLAFRFAARQAIFEFLEQERGEGWWGSKKMANYYAKQATGDDPVKRIKAHPLLTAAAIRQYPFDHAAQGETSLLMAFCPDGVDMKRLSAKKWYTKSAKQASVKLGAKGRELILAHMRQVL